jgi:hypothetical protein
VKRAERSRTRPAGELAELQTGDLVDIYRPTLSKDTPRWNGPATVCDLTSLRDGMIGVRWQGRNLLVRTQDCRRALAFVFAPIFFGGGSSPIETRRRAAESFNGVMRLGWIRKDPSWIACEGNKDHQDVLAAGLHVAAVNLQLLGVFGFRFGRSVKTISGILCDESLLCWWQPPHFHAWCHAFADGSKSVNLMQLAGARDPDQVAFVQFLMEDGAAITQLRKLNADIANIGGVHEPRMPLIREVPEALLDGKPRRSSRALKMLTDEPQDVNLNPDSSTPNSPTAEVNQPALSSDNPHDDNLEPDNNSSEPDPSEAEPVWFEEGFDMEPDEMIAWTCAAAPPQAPCMNPLVNEVFIITEDDDPAELEISPKLHAYVTMPNAVEPLQLAKNDCLVFEYQEDESQSCVPRAVIERTHNVLTREEALQHADQCKQAMIKELNRWHKHGAWRRMPLSQSVNLLKSKWVLKWKQIQGQKDVKGRLVAQGFQDRQALSTFSGTTSRCGQRIVLAASVQFGWPLVSADVSEAFLRGITFEQLAKLDSSQPLRVVEIALPSGSEELLRTLPGMHDFNPAEECLSLLKPGFGLKDAPRLWNLALQNVLKEAGLIATQTDRQLYAKHQGPDNQLCLLLSVHVDDIKITGIPSEIEKLLKILTAHFDELKLENDNFEHLGLKHTLEADGSRCVSQEHYAQELKFISETGCKHDNPVDDSLKMQYIHCSVVWPGLSKLVQTLPCLLQHFNGSCKLQQVVTLSILTVSLRILREGP